VYVYTIKVYKKMMTQNEKSVLRMLFSALGENYSINEIARQCNLAPNGALKILKKFEKEGILKSKSIANIKSYSLNFDSEKTKNILKLALIPELKGRLKFRLEDLKQLKEFTKACIIFGSYSDLKKEPNDMDIFFIIEKQNFKKYKQITLTVYKAIPVKVHDILQTEKDFASNLKKRDKVILEILKKGVILWGYDKIIKIVENGYKR